MNAKRGFSYKAVFSPLNRFVSRAILLAAFIVVALPASSAETNTPAANAKVGNLLRDHRGDIVIIKGKTGAGSGFIFTRAGRRFLVSNVHVMAGIKSPTFTALDRMPLKFKPGATVIAVGHDIIMLELQPGSNGIPLVESFENAVTINDPIVVFGNTGGGDVATAIGGKVVGIGPNRIEIDAEIEHGNSGSPIIHAPSGKVIGVATYVVTDDLISGKKIDRRFGYRLDTVRQWEPVDWTQFYSDADKLEKITATTSELQRAFFELNGLNERTNKFRVYSYDSPVIRNALDDFYPAFAQAETQSDATRAVDELLGTFKSVSKTYPLSTKPTFTYDYFRRQFYNQESTRTEVIKSFVNILQK